MKTVGIKVSGKVQGVFFRKYTVESAIRIGIRGFVQNTSEGNVYIEAQGTEEGLQQFIQWCYKGSPMSNVKSVEITDLPDNSYNGFIIRY